jgi:dipeptidyl aminopeptidase/acylaminoacyl peptidase
VFWDCTNPCGSFETVNPDGSDRRQLIQGVGPEWSPDGTKIAFESYSPSHVSTVNGDGTGLVPVAPGQDPSWSPDGTQLVFERRHSGGTRYDLLLMNADGTNQSILLANATNNVNDDVSWSPDGKRIAFSSDLRFPGGSARNLDIYTIDVDGTKLTRLTTVDPNSAYYAAEDPDWSPDGQRIAYTYSVVIGDIDSAGIAVMNADGSNNTVVVPAANEPDGGSAAAWSPDGTKIAFQSAFDIYVIDARPGATRQFVTTGEDPDWQPIPLNYARPRGASPFLTYLVPAYRSCSAPNRAHGSPLAFGSCAPPAQASSHLTLGTPDANGHPAATIGTVRYRVATGDVKIDVNVTGVLTQGTLAPYGGELALDNALRLTDRDNTPNPGGPGPGTVQDTSFPVTVPCAAGACSVATTANAVAPGAVIAGKRAIWQLGQVQVYDGGSDGLASTTADNTLFMDQGVFVP